MPHLLIEFSDPAAAAGWRAIYDRVMGGLSTSRLAHDPSGHAVFEGVVSLERNGGFASVRSAPAALGLPGARSCVIDARGPALRFKLNLLTEDTFDGLVYQAPFIPETRRQVLHIPLSRFVARFRGREVPAAPPLDPVCIRQVGLMLADRQAGPFALAVWRIGLA